MSAQGLYFALPPARAVDDKSSRSVCSVCGIDATLRCGACSQVGFSELIFCSKAHQKLVWPGHKAVCGEGRAAPFVLPDLSENDLHLLHCHADGPVFYKEKHPRIGALLEGLLQLPEGFICENVSTLNEHLKLTGTIDGVEAKSVVGQLLYSALWEQRNVARKTAHLPSEPSFSPVTELDASATCFVSVVLFHMDILKIDLPPKALDRFLHRLVIWWTLLRVMSRQQGTGILTPLEVTPDHLDIAMQLLSLEILPFMSSSRPWEWSPFFQHITNPMWIIPKMNSYKSAGAPYGTATQVVWRILPIDEYHYAENLSRGHCGPF